MPVFDDPMETINIYGPIANSVTGSDYIFADRYSDPASSHGRQSNAQNESQMNGESVVETADAIYRKVAWQHSVLVKLIEDAEKLDKTLSTNDSGLDIEHTPYLSSRDRHAQCHREILDKVAEKNVYGALSSRTRQRAVKGYLFNCARNFDIVQDDPWLQDVWSWVGGAQEVVEAQGMQEGTLDLAYLGVHGIWNEDLGLNPDARLIGTKDMPTSQIWTSTIASINRRAGRRSFEGALTSKPQHRQLCLAICGWGKSTEELAIDLARFEQRGQHTKAAVWALCEKQPEMAVDALQRGGSDYMFIALALELQNQGAAPIDKSKWDVLIGKNQQMAKDPYLRAIYALISTSNWSAIAGETSLPLRERVGIALRNLGDSELTQWLQDALQDATKAGDIEGIVLAGLSDKYMDILANYVTAFGDIQSAVLIMSFTVPAYFEDIRFNAFRTEYRHYLNTHRLHVKRALFDAQAGKLSKLRGTEKSKLPELARQVTLRCVHCNSGLANDRSNTDIEPKYTTAVNRPNHLIASGVNGGIACPSCGKHLPRCAVCLQTLGLPRSDLQSNTISNSVSSNEQLKEDLQKSFITFCMKCPHAMHADHAAEWFKRHVECPVSDCKCRCYEDEARIRREREVREEYERRLLERGRTDDVTETGKKV